MPLPEELRVHTAGGIRFVGDLLALQAQAGQSDFTRLALRVSRVAEMQCALPAAPLADFLTGVARRQLDDAGLNHIARTVEVGCPANQSVALGF